MEDREVSQLNIDTNWADMQFFFNMNNDFSCLLLIQQTYTITHNRNA